MKIECVPVFKVNLVLDTKTRISAVKISYFLLLVRLRCNSRNDQWASKLFQIIRFLYAQRMPRVICLCEIRSEFFSRSVALCLLSFIASFLIPWTRHAAILYLVFLFVLLHTSSHRASFWNFSAFHSFYVNKPSYSMPFNELDNSPPLNYSSNTSFRRILNNSFSFTGPYIFRSIFFSNTANALSSCMVSVHDSEPYVTTMRSNLQCICNLLLLDMRLLLTSCLLICFRRLFNIKRFFFFNCVIVYKWFVFCLLARLGTVLLVFSGRICYQRVTSIILFTFLLFLLLLMMVEVTCVFSVILQVINQHHSTLLQYVCV